MLITLAIAAYFGLGAAWLYAIRDRFKAEAEDLAAHSSIDPLFAQLIDLALRLPTWPATVRRKTGK